MACSKPIVPKNQDGKELRIDKREVDSYTWCFIEDAVSIDVIYGYLSGPDNNYYCCNMDHSMHCYTVLKKDILQEMDSTGMPVLFFEELQTDLNNILVVVLHQKKEKGNREHMILLCLVQMSLMTATKVGYCKNYRFTSKIMELVVFLSMIKM